MHTQRAAVRLSVTYSYYDDVTDANKPSLDRIVLPRCTVAHPLLSPPRRLCFHRRLFVCLFVGTIKQKKLRNRCSQNSVERWHMVHGKKILEYGGNPDHFTSGLGPSMRSICVTWRRFNNNSFATSAALSEVCALLSAILANTGRNVTMTYDAT